MQITPPALDAIFYNFSLIFQNALARRAPWSAPIATQVPSTTRENRYPWMARIPRLHEWIGDRVINNVAARSTSITNKDYELTIGVDRNDVEDDNLGVYSPLIAQMGEQAALWPDDLIKALLQAGVSTLCWDGQYFFDTDHPTKLGDSSSGVYVNSFTSKALSAANYAYVRQQMMQYQDEDGQSLAIMPNLLIVPPQLEDEGRTILNADFIAPSVGVGTNVGSIMQSNILKGSAELLVVPELAGEGTVWYLADTTKPLKPLIFQLRKSPAFVSKTEPNSENVFHRKEFLYGVDARGNAGYGLPQLMARAIA